MIIHIDMDAFYASVEHQDHPDLKGKCIIVGGASDRSVVSAASYEARKFGVHSAMPMYQARQKCPHGIFLPPRMSRYQEMSASIMNVLRAFSPLVEPVSIDEAYIDSAGCTRLHGQPVEIAMEIKNRIRKMVGLSCSVGIAPNKILAKIASEMDKPDGLFVISPNEAQSFIQSLPIHKIPGVGKMTGKKLELLGISTLSDIKQYNTEFIIKKLGKFGRRLIELSDCIDDSKVTPDFLRKSVSSETTLPENTKDPQVLKRYILKQADEVGKDLRKMEVKAKTIVLKIKYADFRLKTRSSTLEIPTQSSEMIFREALKLLHSQGLDGNIRLIGVGASGLLPAETPIQQELFDEKDHRMKWSRVDQALDAIAEKYGKNFVKRGTFYNTEEKR